MGRPFAIGGADIPPPGQRLCTIHNIPIPPSRWRDGCHLSGCTECSDERKPVAPPETVAERLEISRASGNSAVKSGQLKRVAPLGGMVTCHNRYHTARGITNPKCMLCAGMTVKEIYDEMQNANG